MKVEIDDLLVSSFRNSTDCYGMGKEEIKEYLTDLVDELLRDHISSESLDQNEIDDQDENWSKNS